MIDIGHKFKSLAEVKRVFTELPQVQQFNATRSKNGFVVTALFSDRIGDMEAKARRAHAFYERNKKRGWECVSSYYIATDEDFYRFQRL
jgi:hypothetical protein